MKGVLDQDVCVKWPSHECQDSGFSSIILFCRLSYISHVKVSGFNVADQYTFLCNVLSFPG